MVKYGYDSDSCPSTWWEERNRQIHASLDRLKERQARFDAHFKSRQELWAQSHAALLDKLLRKKTISADINVVSKEEELVENTCVIVGEIVQIVVEDNVPEPDKEKIVEKEIAIAVGIEEVRVESHGAPVETIVVDLSVQAIISSDEIIEDDSPIPLIADIPDVEPVEQVEYTDSTGLIAKRKALPATHIYLDHFSLHCTPFDFVIADFLGIRGFSLQPSLIL